MEFKKDYTPKNNKGFGGNSIFKSGFESELKQNILIAFKDKSTLFLSDSEIKSNMTSKSDDYKQTTAQKLKDICKSLKVGYNGIIKRDDDLKGYAIVLKNIPTNTFKVSHKIK